MPARRTLQQRHLEQEPVEPSMCIIIRASVALAAVLVSFGVWRSIRLSASGELMWFVTTPHSVTLTNGNAGGALLHHCCQSQIWIWTRRAGAERESYAIIPPATNHKGYVWRCDGWAAPRLPVFPYLVYWTDAPFACDSVPGAPTRPKGLADRQIRFGDRSVAFLADNGDSLAIKW
jgi:hypothetical protein